MAADPEVQKPTNTRVTVSRGWRSLIPYAIIVAVGGALSFVVKPPPLDPNAPPVSLDQVPKQLGDWSYVEDIQLTDNEKKYLVPDATLYRTYRAKNGRWMSALVVYRRSERREFFHTPEACYPAGGLRILNRETITLQSPDPKIPAVRITADSQGETLLTLYWFSSGDRLAGSTARQQLLMWLDRMSRNDQGWAFVRLITPQTDEGESADALEDFAKYLAPEVMKAIREADMKK